MGDSVPEESTVVDISEWQARAVSPIGDSGLRRPPQGRPFAFSQPAPNPFLTASKGEVEALGAHRAPPADGNRSGRPRPRVGIERRPLCLRQADTSALGHPFRPGRER